MGVKKRGNQWHEIWRRGDPLGNRSEVEQKTQSKRDQGMKILTIVAFGSLKLVRNAALHFRYL